MNREDYVRIAREAIAGINRPEWVRDPMRYDPDEWVIEAIATAFKIGRAHGRSEADGLYPENRSPPVQLPASPDYGVPYYSVVPATSHPPPVMTPVAPRRHKGRRR